MGPFSFRGRFYPRIPPSNCQRLKSKCSHHSFFVRKLNIRITFTFPTSLIFDNLDFRKSKMFRQLSKQLRLSYPEWNVADNSAVHILLQLCSFHIDTHSVELTPMQWFDRLLACLLIWKLHICETFGTSGFNVSYQSDFFNRTNCLEKIAQLLFWCFLWQSRNVYCALVSVLT